MRVLKLLKLLVPKVGRDNAATREKWLEDSLLNIPNGSRILDAGAGTQQYQKFCKHLKYVSQDFGQYDGMGNDAALQTGEFDYGELDIVCDITSIPEPDSSFDAIMCVEVLEHLPNPALAIKEFARLLKPGGHLIITAPFCSLTHFAPYHFSSGLNRYWYEEHLPSNGFKDLEISPNGNYFEFIAQEIHRIPSVANRYSGCKPNFLGLIGIFFLLRMLARFSKSDNGSSELLCFGYHIHSRKT